MTTIIITNVQSLTLTPPLKSVRYLFLQKLSLPLEMASLEQKDPNTRHTNIAADKSGQQLIVDTISEKLAKNSAINNDGFASSATRKSAYISTSDSSECM